LYRVLDYEGSRLSAADQHVAGRLPIVLEEPPHEFTICEICEASRCLSRTYQDQRYTAVSTGEIDNAVSIRRRQIRHTLVEESPDEFVAILLQDYNQRRFRLVLANIVIDRKEANLENSRGAGGR
ncbi:MAG TPA: hypothetical protein VE527_17790, partial [Reyranella sp.]|nr:hypothetical protein [Reyranella sp.]